MEVSKDVETAVARFEVSANQGRAAGRQPAPAA
jgi:hypothetical protein